MTIAYEPLDEKEILLMINEKLERLIEIFEADPVEEDDES